MMRDLFEEEEAREAPLAPGAMVFRGFAERFEAPCVTALRQIVEVAPFRHMVTPRGFRMSVAMTNCGAAGCKAVTATRMETPLTLKHAAFASPRDEARRSVFVNQ